MMPYKTKPKYWVGCTGNKYDHSKYTNIEKEKWYNGTLWLPLPLDEYPYTIEWEESVKPKWAD